MLLRHLRDRGGVPRIERADQHLGALVDQTFRPAAGRVDVRLGVRVQELHLDAKPLAQQLGGEIRPLLARLADERLQPRTGKQQTDLQLRGLRVQPARQRGERQRPRGRDAERASGYGSHSCTPTMIMLPVLCGGAAAGGVMEDDAYTTS